MVTAAMKLKDAPWKESYDQPRQHTKKQRHYFVNKDPSTQGYGFSSGTRRVGGLLGVAGRLSSFHIYT